MVQVLFLHRKLVAVQSIFVGGLRNVTGTQAFLFVRKRVVWRWTVKTGQLEWRVCANEERGENENAHRKPIKLAIPNGKWTAGERERKQINQNG